ncbi:MAG: 2-oxoacid:acceptor oxidoreductase subunit alpha [Nanoarchaeota archaeon]
MKAVILAAGYATRLYPLTLDQPKPLLKIGGKAIIEHITDKLSKFDMIDYIYVVTNNKFYSHFLGWLEDYQVDVPIKIVNDGTLSNEDRLGAIGDINLVVKRENIDDDLLVVGGDNLFEDNLNEFLKFFNEKGSSILLNDVKSRELAKLYGIVTLNNQGRIINFVEKPENPESTLASTLIYALERKHLLLLQETLDKGLADRAGDFIKYLSCKEEVYGLTLKDKWFDIGSLEQLKEAEEHFKSQSIKEHTKKNVDSFVLKVGGEAGWGIASAADIFAKVCINLGYHVFSSKDYASQIKGGHNYHTIRVSKKPIYADVDDVNMLLALDNKTLEEHNDKVVSQGIILHDDKVNLDYKSYDQNCILVPLKKIEEKLQVKNIHNAVFLGVTIKCLGLELEVLNKVINEYFNKKPELKELLLEAAKEGYDAVEKSIDFPILNEESNLEFLNGNDAITLGALKSKLNFHAQYPMTPVSGILHNLAKESVSNENLVVIQPEDEIAAINMALGASYAGARAMTATSGGGFALMVESLGLAGMAEIPLVVIEGQRPGPSTGLPTKTDQGDLKFVLSAGSGDFPKIIIAPGDIEECYTETKRAFYLAEKYQLPAIVLVDKHLTESFKTIDIENTEKEFVFDYDKRINILNEVENSDLNDDGLFKRYSGNDLRRTIPGTKDGVYTCAGDEHNEVGEITEDKDIRKMMMQRRMGKLELVKKELPILQIIGPKNTDLTVVSWGSNKGAVFEAIEKMNLESKKVNYLHIKFMVPFNKEEVKEVLTQAKRLLLVENNYSGQLGQLIREKTGIEIKDKILRYDGRAFTVDDIYNELKKRV